MIKEKHSEAPIKRPYLRGIAVLGFFDDAVDPFALISSPLLEVLMR
jgi:hypothetical protein